MQSPKSVVRIGATDQPPEASGAGSNVCETLASNFCSYGAERWRCIKNYEAIRAAGSTPEGAHQSISRDQVRHASQP